MADKWRMEGTILDACNCKTLCPCNYAQGPTQDDCRASAAWHIEKGRYGNTKLDGLHFALVAFASGDPLTMGIDKAAVILDEKATAAQRDALSTILGGQAGGFWEMASGLLKSPPEVTSAKFEYKNNGRAWSVRAGNLLEVRAGFLQAPPKSPLKSEPKKAQTYDPFMGPTMEKVVGISAKYRANVAGLNYDVVGRYSSSGRFAYQGP